MAQNSGGGALTAPNRAPAAKVLAGALSNSRVAQALIGALGSHGIQGVIIATSTSTTVDFGSVLVGDYLVHIPAVAGGAVFETVAIAGTKPSAAVVGDMYIVLRKQNLDANNPLAGNKTGNGGTEF